MRRFSFGLLLCWIVPICVGCGGGGDVSGKVLLDGKPVPKGKIYFSPDASKDNDGPQGFADIVDGTYSTRKTGNRGPTGHTIVRIEMQVGEDFYEYETKMELPEKGITKDFEISSSDARKAPIPVAPDI